MLVFRAWATFGAAQKGKVFALFWSENGYRPIWIWNRVRFSSELARVYARIHCYTDNFEMR